MQRMCVDSMTLQETALKCIDLCRCECSGVWPRRVQNTHGLASGQAQAINAFPSKCTAQGPDELLASFELSVAM